jgi:ribosome-associated protein
LTRQTKSSSPSPGTSPDIRAIVLAALDDLKAREISEIDVRDKTSITDLIIVASGTSTRHVKSIADEVVRLAKRNQHAPLGVEGEREGEWVLVDLGDVIVHVMLPRVREFYGLERLWSVGRSAEDLVSA